MRDLIQKINMAINNFKNVAAIHKATAVEHKQLEADIAVLMHVCGEYLKMLPLVEATPLEATPVVNDEPTL